ncbi:MAG TPA: amidase [Gemmatimonadaceae bacterium]|jgi:amidase
MTNDETQSISRRSFVTTSLAAGALMGTGVNPLLDLHERSKSPSPPQSAERASGIHNVGGPVEEKSITQLQEAMHSGVMTSRALVEAYRARIADMDKELRAVIELNPDALSIADGMDAERKSGKTRGPLHGIPILIKDNVGTADKMETTAGSLALVGARPPRDAFLVERLRAAGAVLLGKTNLSEWANFRSTHASSGWSGRGGQCRNPYALDRTPSGSSSGSAAAVASSFCAAAIGSETNGSIVSPSATCSLVGIKPTVGLVSRSVIIPISRTQDTAGPIARTVTDAAILLGGIIGADPRDKATMASGAKRESSYATGLDANALHGMRIGVPREQYFGYSTSADSIAQHAIDLMREKGAVIVDPVPIEKLGAVGEAEFEVLLYEFKAGINEYLASLGTGSKMRTLTDLIEFNESHKSTEMPYFGQEIFEQAQKRGPLTDAKYTKALAKARLDTRARGIDAIMNAHKLDALVAPTNGPAWLIDLVNGDADGGGSSSPAAEAGYPSITVPAGYAFGLPVGISFFGRAWSEAKLIRIAYSFEQAANARHAPTYGRTAVL